MTNSEHHVLPLKNRRSLYNLKDDISETTNLYDQSEYAEIQNDLMNEITIIIQNGRSTKGKKLKNEGPEFWEALYWL